MNRSTMLREISRRATNHPTHLTDPNRMLAAVGQITDARWIFTDYFWVSVVTATASIPDQQQILLGRGQALLRPDRTSELS
jgi:uncharacterized membrane protein YwaF